MWLWRNLKRKACHIMVTRPFGDRAQSITFSLESEYSCCHWSYSSGKPWVTLRHSCQLHLGVNLSPEFCEPVFPLRWLGSFFPPAGGSDILNSDWHMWQWKEERFQGFKVLLSFLPLGARRRSYICTRHSLWTSTWVLLINNYHTLYIYIRQK